MGLSVKSQSLDRTIPRGWAATSGAARGREVKRVRVWTVDPWRDRHRRHRRASGFRSDVRVRDGRTPRGPGSGARWRSEIDATGAVVTPGSSIRTPTPIRKCSGTRRWTRAAARRDHHAGRQLQLVALPGHRGEPGGCVGPVRVHRGRAPPPVRRQRPLDVGRTTTAIGRRAKGTGINLASWSGTARCGSR